MIQINYLTDQDHNWRDTDSNGHEHRWHDAPDHYPTLREDGGDTHWCDDCRDEHADTWLVCRQCGERVTPGITGPGSMTIPGVTSYFLNGEPITKEHADVLLATLL